MEDRLRRLERARAEGSQEATSQLAALYGRNGEAERALGVLSVMGPEWISKLPTEQLKEAAKDLIAEALRERDLNSLLPEPGYIAETGHFSESNNGLEARSTLSFPYKGALFTRSHMSSARQAALRRIQDKDWSSVHIRNRLAVDICEEIRNWERAGRPPFSEGAL